MENSGEEVENREVNVNSNLYKFRQKKAEDNKRILEGLDHINKQIMTLIYNQTLLMQEIKKLKKA
ncbi:hypothetical protein [Bacillus wiedmannii]|uniref:hypothetical protein n=1 Tax=Bacillus wiedmannii TaxID=1890302 RepID=UPI003D9981F6